MKVDSKFIKNYKNSQILFYINTHRFTQFYRKILTVIKNNIWEIIFLFDALNFIFFILFLVNLYYEKVGHLYQIIDN